LFEPAISLASEGFTVSAKWQGVFAADGAKDFSPAMKDPGSAEYFYPMVSPYKQEAL